MEEPAAVQPTAEAACPRRRWSTIRVPGGHTEAVPPWSTVGELSSIHTGVPNCRSWKITRRVISSSPRSNSSYGLCPWRSMKLSSPWTGSGSGASPGGSTTAWRRRACGPVARNTARPKMTWPADVRRRRESHRDAVCTFRHNERVAQVCGVSGVESERSSRTRWPTDDGTGPQRDLRQRADAWTVNSYGPGSSGSWGSTLAATSSPPRVFQPDGILRLRRTARPRFRPCPACAWSTSALVSVACHGAGTPFAQLARKLAVRQQVVGPHIIGAPLSHRTGQGNVGHDAQRHSDQPETAAKFSEANSA
jgi:hypothetical protein